MYQSVIDEAEVIHVVCDKSEHRKGFTTTLLVEMMSILNHQNINQIFLEVRNSNIAAQDLYTNLGFVIVGKRPNYYINTTDKEDAIIMKKTIT